ncbi:hypothetical protein CU254_06035 [Amycolatopsis sp. AA4]|uniref:hypothetical protein n=1 Tax=Actinomycetes TaxID=1760 RepID=UPI0001B54FAE|nr:MULTISPECIES: hypothetical protein [Actinomycetes]ATY10066.1 hypothetical protein CU254_06035 [Amycolatopsis sp. AA4]EFL05503.1 predicted protein [Streptomyces sp. AA4]
MNNDAGDPVEDEGEPLSAAESLELIALQHERTRRELRVSPARLLGVWAFTWLFGWGLVYLSDERSAALLPGWVAGLVVAVLMAGAIAYSAWHGSKPSRGIRGPSRRIGAMYGWSWGISFAALCLIDIRVTKLLPEGSDLVPLLWSGTSLLLTGALYLAGGMLWQDLRQYFLGGWIIVCGGASVLVGVPGNFLVLSLAGGGGFAVAALVYVVRPRD